MVGRKPQGRSLNSFIYQEKDVWLLWPVGKGSTVRELKVASVQPLAHPMQHAHSQRVTFGIQPHARTESLKA